MKKKLPKINTVRQTIKTETNDDWLAGIMCSIKEQAIAYLQSLPDGCYLEINWHGYDCADGTVTISRLETDEEYEERIQREKEEAEKLLAKQKAKAEKRRQDDMAAIAELEKTLAIMREKVSKGSV